MTTQLPAPPASVRRRPPARLRRLAAGSPDDPRWVRPALWAVLVLAAVLYGWGLSKNGYANEFYSAAVKSGTQSWKAFFFGSLDAKSFITVDKPPMALWLMELSARIFGFDTWSLLVPQVLIGVATVAVLYATVRRAFGPVAGVLAALVMTLTPVTVAINRDNNPDTLLVFFLVLAAWACQRAMDSGRLRWLLASAFFVGCGFNTKMLQAWIALPALTLVYLFLGPGGWGRRIVRLLAAGAVLLVSSFWWMVIVDLIPAGRRPYIGGSTDGTAWNLIIGYNGIGRITGEGDMPGGGARMPGGGRGFGGFGGQPGLGRMFGAALGGQISWLLPFAALALVALVVLYRRRPRTDLARATLLLWGGWLIVHFVVFSFANGIFHPYYSTAMAPAIAALAAAGAVALFDASARSLPWSGVMALGVAATGGWAYVLLRRSPDWNPWLAWAVTVLTAVAVLSLLAAQLVRTRSGRPDQSETAAERSARTVPAGTRGGRAARLALIAGVAGLVAGLAGPAAYAATTAGHRTDGTNPMAGPAGSGMGFPGGGRMPGGARPPAGLPEMGGRPPEPPGGFPGGFPAGGRGTGGPPGGAGMPGGAGSGMLSYLEKHRDGATWLVAVSNSQSAASIILRTGQPAISMFGFVGGDRAMTVPRLQQLVSAGKLHYVLAGGGGPGGGGFGRPGGGGSAVTSWVTKNCTVVEPADYGSSTQGGESLYRCG